MTDEEAAHQYRLKQAEKPLKVFEEAHHRPVVSIDELTAWVGSPEGKAALARHHDENGKINSRPRLNDERPDAVNAE